MERENKDVLFGWKCVKCGKVHYIEEKLKDVTCNECGLTATITEYS